MFSMDKEFNVNIEKDEERFYIATVTSSKGCHRQAKSLNELVKKTKEAIELCLQEQVVVYNYDFVGIQKLTVKESPKIYSSKKNKNKSIH